MLTRTSMMVNIDNMITLHLLSINMLACWCGAQPSLRNRNNNNNVCWIVFDLCWLILTHTSNISWNNYSRDNMSKTKDISSWHETRRTVCVLDNWDDLQKSEEKDVKKEDRGASWIFSIRAKCLWGVCYLVFPVKRIFWYKTLWMIWCLLQIAALWGDIFVNMVYWKQVTFISLLKRDSEEI